MDIRFPRKLLLTVTPSTKHKGRSIVTEWNPLVQHITVLAMFLPLCALLCSQRYTYDRTHVHMVWTGCTRFPNYFKQICKISNLNDGTVQIIHADNRLLSGSYPNINNNNNKLYINWIEAIPSLELIWLYFSYI